MLCRAGRARTGGKHLHGNGHGPSNNYVVRSRHPSELPLINVATANGKIQSVPKEGKEINIAVVSNSVVNKQPWLRWASVARLITPCVPKLAILCWGGEGALANLRYGGVCQTCTVGLPRGFPLVDGLSYMFYPRPKPPPTLVGDCVSQNPINDGKQRQNILKYHRASCCCQIGSIRFQRGPRPTEL